MIKFLELKNYLNNNFAPLIMLCGNDQWIRQRAIQYITASLDIEYRDMNIHSVDTVKKVEDLMMVCNTQPFFSQQKLVVVHGMDISKGQQASNMVSALNKYIAESDKSCCMVLMLDDKTTSLLSKLDCTSVKCDKLDDKDVIKWIISTVTSNQRSIDNATANKICQYCLADMGRVSSEVAKLCVHSTDSITSDMVELLVTKDVEYLVYNLAKVIATRDTATALDMWATLVRQGNEPRSLFGMIYRYYRRMYYIRITPGDNATLASQLDVKPTAVSFAKDIASKYKPRQLLDAIELFAEADNKIKSFANEQDTMQLLMLQLVAL